MSSFPGQQANWGRGITLNQIRERAKSTITLRTKSENVVSDISVEGFVPEQSTLVIRTQTWFKLCIAFEFRSRQIAVIR